MIRLGVGLDSLVALREQFGGREPDLLAAVHDVRLGGGDHVLLHATESRKPVTERDVRTVVESGALPLCLEIDASPALVAWAVSLGAAKPASVMLVPPPGQHGGLSFDAQASAIEKAHGDLRDAGLAVILAVEPDEKALVAAAGIGADIVELRTGRLANAPAEDARVVALAALARAAATARTLGMRVRAGGGLDEVGVERVASLEDIEVVTVGRTLVARAVFLGLRAATAAFVGRVHERPSTRVEEGATS